MIAENHGRENLSLCPEPIGSAVSILFSEVFLPLGGSDIQDGRLYGPWRFREPEVA